MWKAKISFRAEDDVVKNHKIFPQLGEVYFSARSPQKKERRQDIRPSQRS